MDVIRVGLVTVSDRASLGAQNGGYDDLGGPAMRDWVEKAILNPVEFFPRLIVDEQPLIEKTLMELCDVHQCDLVLTTGGTGPAKRDVTPEATAAVCHKILDGFAEQMRAVSLKVVPTAILSRQIAGTRNSSLVINLPGKPSAIADCLGAVFAAVPYCIDLIEGRYIFTRPGVIEAFRPKNAQRPYPSQP